MLNSNKYTLICSDIDGTLLNKEKSLSLKTINEFQRINKAGVHIILASSRSPESIRLILQEANLNQPVISYNGALIVTEINKNGDLKIIYDETISVDTSEIITSKCEELGIHSSLYYHDNWFACKEDFWSEKERKNTRVNPKFASLKEVIKLGFSGSGFNKIMCMGEEEKINVLEKYFADDITSEVAVYRTKSTYLEISPANTNKFKSLIILCDFLKIEMAEVIAFGDNYNDIDMIKNVGMGVAVDNAVKEVKDVARFISGTNLNDGVAHAIAKFL